MKRRRNSLHWMSQPRGLNGRFTKGGGSNDYPEWFVRMPWQKKLLVVLATSAVAVAIYAWLPGLVIPLAILGWIMILAK